ncbi:MAG: hypothetical protein AAF928_19195 [Myxococcota bacterium]
MEHAAYWSDLDERLGAWVDKAVRRKPAREARLAGCVRVAARHCPALREKLATAADALIGRAAFERPLYGASIRAVAEREHRDAAELLTRALKSRGSGGLATIAAAMLAPSTMRLREPLSRVAAAGKPEMAFAAGLAAAVRAPVPRGGSSARGTSAEARRALIGSVARIKESARIELCSELIAPLVMTPEAPSLPVAMAPAFAVLRDAERHLGRWLVLARAGHAAGDDSGVEQARARAGQGSSSARTAWSFLGWAIDARDPAPTLRPSAEVVARLSDRPTSEREMSFLFRLASVRAGGARAMLEGLCDDEIRASDGVRAAAALARWYGDRRGLEHLRRLADGKRHRDLQGVAVAALWDTGEQGEAAQRAERLKESRHLAVSVWGGLVMRPPGPVASLLEEMRFRRLERGWVQ